MAGSGATVSDKLSAEHMPVVTVKTCAWGHAATSSCKNNQPAVAVRGSGHGDCPVLLRGQSVWGACKRKSGNFGISRVALNKI